MKKLSKQAIEGLVTDEMAQEYRKEENKWIYATSVIEDYIEVDDYTNLNDNTMDLAVEILEDALDERYARITYQEQSRREKAEHERKEREAKYNSYATIMLGERVNAVVYIGGEEVQPELDGITRFTGKVIRNIVKAHQDGVSVMVDSGLHCLITFLESPLPEGVNTDNVIDYFRACK